jgi:hypothetical protein
MLYCLVLPCHRDNDVVCSVNATKNLRLEADQVKVNQKDKSAINCCSTYPVQVVHDKVLVSSALEKQLGEPGLFEVLTRQNRARPRQDAQLTTKSLMLCPTHFGGNDGFR